MYDVYTNSALAHRTHISVKAGNLSQAVPQSAVVQYEDPSLGLATDSGVHSWPAFIFHLQTLKAEMIS